jgi:hypothetical protein
MCADSGEQSFIVRVWREGRASEDATPIWRGAIRHVASGEQIYFQCPERLVSFIVANSGAKCWQVAQAPGARRQCP